MRPLPSALFALVAFFATHACLAQDLPSYDPMLAGLDNEEPINVARMSDSDLTCEQLYAESAVIEQRMAGMPRPEDPTALAARMQQEMMDDVQKQQAAMRARSMASSVLSMVPGVGGLASSALAPRGVDSTHMDEQMTRYMQQVQQMQARMRALAEQDARRAHVTNLFLSRGCKVSTLDQAKLQAARRALEGSPAASAPAATPIATAGTGQAASVADTTAVPDAEASASPTPDAAAPAQAPDAPTPSMPADSGA